ncbi:hypothetical protein [Oceanospirillum sediminis]|uniref:Uncharacterized protein n=1 Tax=Oceanospirillum sediminis TaxID=2760088 RepID=A0A839IZZ7_9GAMM|nr:hypothetical protein [Oceanospirillum sediminis]MBB1489656.1 hypothetical protein [Oceanospirillum sediminis]
MNKQERVYEVLTSGRALARALGVSDLTVRKAKERIKQEQAESGRVSPEELAQVIRYLEHGLTLPANKGGAIKVEIKKALKVLGQY